MIQKFISFCLWLCEWVYFVHLQPMPVCIATSSNSPLSLRVFFFSPVHSVRPSLCNLLCVRYTHTRTHLGRRRHRLVRRRRRRRLLCRVSGRCEEVCVCERRYRQVVFIIIVFFPDGYDETPTVHVHNNIQQQYKSFVNNTSTLAAARRRVVAPPSECVVVSEWGVPVVRENKMYTSLLSRHETVYLRFIYRNSSYFTLTLLFAIMWDVELGGDGGAARIPSNPPWPNFPHSVM